MQTSHWQSRCINQIALWGTEKSISVIGDNVHVVTTPDNLNHVAAKCFPDGMVYIVDSKPTAVRIPGSSPGGSTPASSSALRNPAKGKILEQQEDCRLCLSIPTEEEHVLETCQSGFESLGRYSSLGHRQTAFLIKKSRLVRLQEDEPTTSITAVQLPLKESVLSSNLRWLTNGPFV